MLVFTSVILSKCWGYCLLAHVKRARPQIPVAIWILDMVRPKLSSVSPKQVTLKKLNTNAVFVTISFLCAFSIVNPQTVLRSNLIYFQQISYNLLNYLELNAV